MPKKGNQNKAEAIRTMLRELGESASPKGVAEQLTQRGIKVTPGNVSTVKLEMRKLGAFRNGAVKPASVTARAKAASQSSLIDIGDIASIRALVKKHGANDLHRLVDAVAI